MKKLLTLHIAQYKGLRLQYFLLAYLIVRLMGYILEVDLSPLLFGLIFIILIVVFVVLLVQVYDIFGEYSIFIQTIPYKRRTILFSKWLFQLSTVSIMFVFFLIVEAIFYKNSFLEPLIKDSNQILTMIMITIFAIIAMMAVSQMANIVIIVFSRIKRWFHWISSYLFLVVMIFLFVIPPFIMTNFEYLNLTIQFMLASSMYLFYLIVFAAINYIVYMRLDIAGMGNQKMMNISNIYEGR